MHSDQKTNGKDRYPNTFSELKTGPVTLPNRVVFPAWQLNYANPDGTVSEKLMKYYTDLARGGCGLIFTGTAVVSSDGIAFNRVMHVENNTFIPGLKKLFTSIKENGAVAGIQIIHYGRQSSTSLSGDTLRAPSAIPCPAMSQYDPQYKVREMSFEDIEQIREAFIAASIRSAEAGVQVIEVHAAHGYLLSEFLSPYSNIRTDTYGGSPENRARLTIEIIQGIRKKLGNSIAISLRVNGDDYVDGGLKPEDYEILVPLFEKAGIDMLHVSAGVYGSMERIVPPQSLGIAPHIHLAEHLKRYASVPVCGVGSIISRGLNLVESFITEKKTDLCALGRVQMADPFFVKKSLEGRESEINLCIHCNKCTFWTTGDPEVYCSVNKDYFKPKSR